METAINCELPANTRTDIRATASGERPAFCANTPNASPMGMYPKQMGQAACTPARRVLVRGARFLESGLGIGGVSVIRLDGGRKVQGTAIPIPQDGPTDKLNPQNIKK
jgi:hypothetical protein